ncbi:MAG: hypothetical protein KGL39_51920 [Patescibacteria group bacterium]|nr:hypothetical protein [Patescibacteria group bacterium]
MTMVNLTPHVISVADSAGVSRLVKDRVPSRSDVVVPHDLVRDANGAVIGCRGFAL